MSIGDCGLDSNQTIPFEMAKPPTGVTPLHVHLSMDALGHYLEVVCVSVEKSVSQDSLAKIYKERRKGVNPVVVAARSNSLLWIYGPNPEAPALDSLPIPRGNSILQESLNESSGYAAVQRIAQLRERLRTSEDTSIRNAGLFASHHVFKNLPQLKNWNSASERAQKYVSKRGKDLIHALGFTDKQGADNTLLLSPGANKGARAVAVLLNEDETFEAKSLRFKLTPVAWGLKVAAQQEVPWLIVLRGGQIRLYPAKDGVGVGQRSQSDTFFELDLPLLLDSNVAYLDLIFSADALMPGGSTEQILKDSARYASDLGVRLRSRIYESVVPQLAKGVSEQLPNLGLEVNNENLQLAYKLTLRILFRLIFQAYAEDRGLLPYERNARYTDNALKTIAVRDLMDEEATYDPESTSLWADLQQVWRVIDSGDRDWNVPAYNGGLFGADPVRHPEGALIKRLELPNNIVGPALESMLIDETADDARGPVDFRSLSVREFGTIYEGLLESSLSLATEDLTLDKNGAWVPAKAGDSIEAPKGTAYFHNSSGERKATGSYFTPSIIVEHLLDRALEPALKRHLEAVAELLEAGKENTAAEKFFDFRVADLAMGSAHFLVAAVDRIETAFRNFLVDHQIPAVNAELQRLEKVAREALGSDAEFAEDIDQATLLRRQVARRCIYGLDINEMAVELSRLALWIHTFVPGLPMSSLDHGLVCANSLTGIGSIEEAISALDPDSGGTSLFSGALEESLSKAKALLLEAANASEATKQEVLENAEILKKAKNEAEVTKSIFDAAVAARLSIVNAVGVFDIETLIEIGKSDLVQETVRSLAPAHLPYLFPEVFLRDNPGFDVLLGNPPWEEVVYDEPRFWARHFPGLLANKVQDRDLLIDKYQSQRPDLVLIRDQERAHMESTRNALYASFPMGVGHADLYKAFLWRGWRVINSSGIFGVVTPKTAFSALGMENWRREILLKGSFKSLFFITNQNQWAFPIHPQFSIAVAAISRSRSEYCTVSGPHASSESFRSGQAVEIAAEVILKMTEGASIPNVQSQLDVDIMSKMREHPRLDEGNRFRVVQEMNATSDRKWFDSKSDKADFPVFSGATFNAYEPDFGEIFARAEREKVLNELLRKYQKQISLKSSPLYGTFNGIPEIKDLPCMRARVAFRGVTNPTNTRTVIACLIPPETVLTNISPYIWVNPECEEDSAFILGIFNSICFDWYARKLVETAMNLHLVNAFPIPKYVDSLVTKKIVQLSAALSAKDKRFTEWAKLVGVNIGALSTTEERDKAKAEIDALVFLLFGLEERHINHVFQTFRQTAIDEEYLAEVLGYFRSWKKS